MTTPSTSPISKGLRIFITLIPLTFPSSLKEDRMLKSDLGYGNAYLDAGFLGGMQCQSHLVFLLIVVVQLGVLPGFGFTV
ncbi:hypothetical protein RHSIM_Rhsim13G0043300 [Rhododendron simsii]|uniref:Uncharacterized protein n=1 Tax=Rhododendron simsii TaxID=118357 RepID=A0A834L4T0_RHOSS|nr:hypothetical protein RHSIM_Rhsim13G0043300 [Rhododendron simsii]